MSEQFSPQDSGSDHIAHIPLQAQRAGYQHLLALAAGLEPIITVVVHPCDKESLTGAIEAAHAGLIIPIFVAPEKKLRTLATTLSIDLSPYELVSAAHSHDAAAKAVALIREGTGKR